MKLIINNDVFDKMAYWVKKAPGEISGLGIIKTEPGGILRVTNTILLPQKNASASTDIEPEDVCKAMFAFKDEREGSLRWWWHSHANMGVFWSGTDTSTIQAIGGSSPDGWVVSTVINKKHEWKNSIYINSGKKMPWGEVEPLFVDDIPTEVQSLADPREALWDKEYDENVKPFVPTPAYHGGYSHNYPTSTTTRGAGATNSAVDRSLTPEMIAAAEKALYASGRPNGMTKRQWVEIKKKQAEREAKEQPFLNFNKKTQEMKEDKDVYGFTQEEWKLLGEEGIDNSSVDILFTWDFSKDQILEIAESGADIEDVLDMVYDRKTNDQIMFAVREWGDAQYNRNWNGNIYDC